MCRPCPDADRTSEAESCMALILAVVLVSLITSFLCSLCEAALYAVTPARVEALRLGGTSSGRRLARLRERIEEAIAGLGTINTIAQTAGAAWAGALVGELYSNQWLGAFSALLTLTILLLTEIVPIVGEHDAHPEMERMARERTRFHASAAHDERESERNGLKE